MQSQPTIRENLKPVVTIIRQGDLAQALTQSKKLTDPDDHVGQKIRVYLLLANQKYPEADALCTKLLSSGMDHELIAWRGIAKAELGLWSSSMNDLCLAQQFYPQQKTIKQIDFTAQRACRNISEGMRLDGGTFNDFLERARIYVLDQDFVRGERDVQSAQAIDPDRIELCKLRALIALNKLDYATSLSQIETYLEENPEDLDAILVKIKIKATTGRIRSSLALLRQTTRENSQDEIALFKIAQTRFDIRDFHGAIKDYTLLLKGNECLPAAYFGRGKALFEIRKFDDAMNDFEQALKLGGPNASILALLGEAKLARGLTKEASSTFKNALKLEAGCWQARLGYAKVKNNRKKRSEAIKIATDLSKKHPQQFEIPLFLGSVSFDEKDFVTAVEKYTLAIELAESRWDKASCYYRRGTAKLENGQAQEAVVDFEKALDLRPFHVGTLVWRGFANGRLGRWSKAISDLQSAIDMNPMAAEQYKRLGEYIAEQALKHFGEVVQADGADIEAYFNLGMAHLFLGQTDEAFANFEKTLSIDPKHGEAQVRLGTLYLQNRQTKKAYSLFSDAVRTKSSPTALLMRADAMLQMGVLQPAMVDIRDAIRNSRDNDRLYARRGELYSAQKKYEKALDDFTLSIALNFDNYQAFRERGRLFAKREMYADATRDLSMSLHFFPQQPQVMVERGQAYLELKDYENAANDFEAALAFPASADPAKQLSAEAQLVATIGRANAILKLDRGQDALGWLTKAIHRFKTPAEWARLVKARGEIFFAMGRFERASADARIASKLLDEPKFAADCYYLRALCSYFHKDREHTIKTLEKAYSLDENHAQVELALDWFKQMAEEPPEDWKSPPKKIRPQRPQIDPDGKSLEIDSEKWEIAPPMDLWLVKKDEQEFGPIPLKTLVEWAKEGRIDTETRLFRTDWGKWRTGGKLSGASESSASISDLMTPPQMENSGSKKE